MLWDTFVIMYAPTIKTTAPPSMIKWFLFKFKCKLNHTKWTVLLACFQCVDTLLFASISLTILHGRDAILRVRDKWLIINMVSQLWADVKYHVPTGIFAEGEWFLSFWRCHRPRWRERRWWCGVDDSSPNHKPTEPSLWFVVCGLLEIRHAAALTTGAKHWHR